MKFKLVHEIDCRKKCKDRWTLTRDGTVVMTTGSSVRVLQALKGQRLPIPAIMGEEDCWDKEYTITWKLPSSRRVLQGGKI